MNFTLNELKKGEKALILDIDLNHLPIKLIEMGCLPNTEIQVIEKTPFNDPIYLNINNVFLAIRQETAQHILVKKICSSNEK